MPRINRAAGRVVRGGARPGHRHLRHDRRGQELAAEPDPAVLRSARGRILADGRDLRDLDLDAYRRQIGIVYQESFLFSNTVAANIAFGNPHATQEQIERAARTASAHEFITELPHGYETVLGNRAWISPAASASGWRWRGRCCWSRPS
jgi:hypothetical protein